MKVLFNFILELHFIYAATRLERCLSKYLN